MSCFLRNSFLKDILNLVNGGCIVVGENLQSDLKTKGFTEIVTNIEYQNKINEFIDLLNIAIYRIN